MSTETLQIEKKKALVPQLRFQEFDGEWKNEKLLKHVYSISSGKIKPSDEGEFFVYGSTGIIGKSNTYTHEGDYILVARVGANAGQINRAKGKYAVTDNTLIVDLKDNVSVSFCQSFLTKFNLNKLIFGSGQPLITGGLLKSIDFVFPTLPEQQKIASFLSAVDEKIQQLTHKATLLEQYKKGVMQQLFSGKLRFKDENGKDYPDWEEKKLGEVAEKRIIKNKDNKINLVFTNSAVQGIVNQRDFFDKDIANQNNLLGYYIVEKNDFVYNPRISTYAPVGPISRNYLDTGIMSPLYSVFRFKEGNLDFIEYFFNSTIWHIHMKDISNYGARDDRMSFSTSDFYKMLIPFPCLEEQQRIANFLSGIDSKIESVNQQLAQTQTFKKGLLQQLFV